MIVDELYKTMAYKAPPVSLDAAIERMQLVYADDETLAARMLQSAHHRLTRPS